MLSVYDALDGFGMTSESETIGTVTLEAMARGVSVVGTDAGGTSKLLAEGRGLLYPSGQVKDLAEAVQTLVDEPSEARDARSHAGRRYAERCRPQHLVPAWEELLAAVVESKRKA